MRVLVLLCAAALCVLSSPAPIDDHDDHPERFKSNMCQDVLGLWELCVDYELATCPDSEEEFKIKVLVTLDEEIIVDEVITEEDLKNSIEVDLSQLPFPQLPEDIKKQIETCRVSLKLKPNTKPVFKPSYAEFCPDVIVTCGIVPLTIPIDCISLGNDCSSLGDCGSCATKPGCGWCEEKNVCANGIVQHPYCDKCTPESFLFEQSLCPTVAPTPMGSAINDGGADGDGDGKGRGDKGDRGGGRNGGALPIVLIIIVVLGIIGVGGYCWWKKRNESRDGSMRAHPDRGFSQPVRLDDDDEGLYDDVPGPGTSDQINIHMDSGAGAVI